MSGWLSTVRCVLGFVRANRGESRLITLSGGFLQPDQPALWRHYRILLAAVMPRDEGHGRVRSQA